MSADIVRVPLLDAALDGQPEIGQVRSTRIELGAGQEAGRHRHPCDVVGYVAAGEPATFIAFYLLPPGEGTLIEMLPAG